VARIYPALLGAFASFRERNAVVLFPSQEIRAMLEHSAALASLTDRIELRSIGAPTAASAVLTSSGTMSLNCALAGIPGAIAYRANPITYLLGRLLVKVEYLGIANLLLGAPMYPEFIQGAATAAALATELRACVDEPARRGQTAEHAARLRALLSVPAAGTAADWLARQLSENVASHILPPQAAAHADA